MKLLVKKATGVIHDASNEGLWFSEGEKDGLIFQIIPPEFRVVDVPGDAGQSPDGNWKFPWPNDDPARCLWDGAGIVANPTLGPPLDPNDEFYAALIVLKGTGASVDDLIDVMLGQTGKAGRIAGRPVK